MDHTVLLLGSGIIRKIIRSLFSFRNKRDPEEARMEGTNYCLISSLFRNRVMVLNRGGRYLIGRTEEADIYMPHNAVSRRHALLEWIEKGTFCLKDLGSRNGISVNNHRIQEKELSDNDLIEIYPWNFRYKEFKGDLGLLLKSKPHENRTEATQELPQVSAEKPSESKLSGNFIKMELAEICQLLEINKKEGMLRIEGKDASGSIHVSNGRIIWAESGNLEGESAVRRLLSLSEGNFEFALAAAPYGRNLDLPISSILFEIFKEKDEQTLTQKISLEKD